MDVINEILGNKKTDIVAVEEILRDCLTAKDPFYKDSHEKLFGVGLEKYKANMLLAHHISRIKYGYNLSYSTLSHVSSLIEKVEKEESFKKLLNFPFLLVKSSWLFEHAPYFLFLDIGSAELDDYIIKFIREFKHRFKFEASK